MNSYIFTAKHHFIAMTAVCSLIFISCSDVMSRSKDAGSNLPVQEYSGTVEHVFFHPLILFPDNAFSKSRKGGYMCDWFITLREFNFFLDDLYERGYMLVSTKDIYETKNGIPVKKIFKFPAGKKPLILSIDDMNYYKTMQTHGCTKKLVIQNGTIMSLAVTPTGERVIENAEVTQVVDSFVKKHPDFSFNGAKGILALTGYNGVFGYRTHQLKSPDYASEKAEALKIAALLAQNGWEFASHGYRHLQESQVSAEKLDNDARRWKEEVEPIVGATPYHIYPFGDILHEGAPGLDVLKKYGFRYFYGVSFNSKWTEHPGWVYANRIPIDGRYLMGVVSGSRNSQFCNISKVIDPKRAQYFGKQ